MLQSTLNRVMQEEGAARYRTSCERAQKKGEESKTMYGQRLLSGAVVPLIDAIGKWLEDAGSNKPGRKHAAYKFLQPVPKDTLAFLTARAVLDSIGLSKSFQGVVACIGSSVEDEHRTLWLKEHFPHFFKKIGRSLEYTGSYAHKRTRIIWAMRGAEMAPQPGEAPKENQWCPWSMDTRFRVGAILLDLLIKSTGLVTKKAVGAMKHRRYVIQPTEATSEWIRGFNEYAEVLNPMWLPMVEKPNHWTTIYDGGYDTLEGLRHYALVRHVSAAHRDGALAQAQMPDVLAAVNAMQDTPWTINHRVLGIMEHYWNLRREVCGLPRHEPFDLPNKPADIATNAGALKKWKNEAQIVWRKNAALVSHQVAAAKVLNVARRFQNVPKFYFPYFLDFRGRVYATPTFLTPQGTDLAKSLLLFADGVEMLHEEDAYWLAIYGSNLWGNDKVRFEERLAWTKEHEQQIIECGTDPLANQWWQEADEPWQFLAWCLEWTAWKKTGFGFKTHFPVCLDGTNNGLQILSMLTRDMDAARATNVAPSPAPRDIYGDVAKQAVAFMQEDAKRTAPTTREIPWPKMALELRRSHDLKLAPKQAKAIFEGTEAAPKKTCDAVKKVVALYQKSYIPPEELARYWLAFGIDRKTCKRPVMVLPYGGTFHSCTAYLREWYEEALEKHGEATPDSTVALTRVGYLARKVWDAIDSRIGLPRQAMAWFQECAAILTEEGLPIRWTSPSGLPVLQEYKDDTHYRIETTLGDGITMRFALTGEAPTLSRTKQKAGISPNFVHSCDAAALVKTIALCLKCGIGSYAMIHDSFGTHAPRVHELAAATRQAFLEIFRVDRLSLVREEWQAQLVAAGSTAVLPQPPAPGALDIEQLKDSEFFFA